MQGEELLTKHFSKILPARLEWDTIFGFVGEGMSGKIAALPVFMKDRAHNICDFSSGKSLAQRPGYKVHDWRKVQPFTQSPLYSEGLAGLAPCFEDEPPDEPP
jgi:hypothetical protein